MRGGGSSGRQGAGMPGTLRPLPRQAPNPEKGAPPPTSGHTGHTLPWGILGRPLPPLGGGGVAPQNLLERGEDRPTRMDRFWMTAGRVSLLEALVPCLVQAQPCKASGRERR